MRKYRPLTKADIMPFGKYKGDTIAEIMDKDYSYFKWLRDNTDVRFDLSKKPKEESKSKEALLSTVLKTGRYAGLTVAEVIRYDVEYIKLNLKGRMDWRCEYYCKCPEYALKGLGKLLQDNSDTEYIPPDKFMKRMIEDAHYQRMGLEYMASVRPESPPFN